MTSLNFIAQNSIVFDVENSSFELNNEVKREKLSDQFKTNFEYVDNPTLSYKKVMESGYWFGISYKIF